MNPKQLDIAQMLAGHVNRLRYVIRFSTCRVSHRESVAEHSYFVALYAMLICDWIHDQGTQPALSSEAVLRRCLIHDMEEARTGDMPRQFKTGYLLEQIKAAGERSLVLVLTPLVPRDRVSHYVDTWRIAKHYDIEGRIVRFADFLSALSFLIQEQLDHSSSIWDHAEPLQGYWREFQGSDFEFIRPLVAQVQPIMEELFRRKVEYRGKHTS